MEAMCTNPNRPARHWGTTPWRHVPPRYSRPPPPDPAGAAGRGAARGASPRPAGAARAAAALADSLMRPRRERSIAGLLAGPPAHGGGLAGELELLAGLGDRGAGHVHDHDGVLAGRHE